MNKTELLFSENGAAVSIRFKNGKESLEFESKEEAIFAIHDCFEKGKITKDEVKTFIKQITLSKLPDRDRRMPLLPLLLLSAALSAIIEVERDEEDQKITDPHVGLCDCGHNRPHAYIYNGNEPVTPPFQFRSDGLYFVKNLLDAERITEGDAASLNTMIDLLPLPESSTLN